MTSIYRSMPTARIFQVLFITTTLTAGVWASSPLFNNHTWQAPGCHLVGHTRTVFIPGCRLFKVMLGACRGFCVSYAIPSPDITLRTNPDHRITSRAECCGISSTRDKVKIVPCRRGRRRIVFKSATSCSCSVCRRDQ